MALKVSHTNKKNTSFPVQVILGEEGSEAKSLTMVMDGFFYSEVEFITSSMRLMVQRQLLKVETGVSLPDNLEYGVVYSPTNQAKKIQELTDEEYLERNLRRGLRIPEPDKPVDETVYIETEELKPVEDVEGFMEKLQEQLKKTPTEMPLVDGNLKVNYPLDVSEIPQLSVEEHRELRPEMYNEDGTAKTKAQIEDERDAAAKVKEYKDKVPELKTGKWDEEEVKYLRRVYPKHGAKYVAEKLNRAEKSVYKKAESLKVKKRKT